MPQIEHIVVLMMENHSYDDHFGMLKRGDGFKLGPTACRSTPTPTRRASCSRRSTCRRRASSTRIPSQDWDDEPHRVQQRPQRRVRRRLQRPGRDGLLGRAPTSPSTTGSAETFPVCGPLVLLGARADVPEPPLPHGRHRGRDHQHEQRRSRRARAAERHDPRPPHRSTASPGATTTATSPGSRSCPPPSPARTAAASRRSQEFITDAAAGKLPAVSYVDPNFDKQSEENPQDIRQGERFAAAVINAVDAGPGVGEDVADLDLRRARRLLRPRPAAGRDPARQHPARTSTCRPTNRARTTGTASASRPSSCRRTRKPNYVSHVVHDHTSVLKLIETKWNLGALTFRDANADNLLDSLDFTHARVPGSADVARARAARVGRGRRERGRDRPLLDGEPGGTDPPPEAVVPASYAGKLRVGAT